MESYEMLKRVMRELSAFLHWFVRSKTAIVLVVILLLLIPGYVFYLIVVVPVSTCERDFFPGDTSGVVLSGLEPDSTQEILETVQTIGALEMEKAFLGSLLTLSKEDSVYLNLNLADSLLLLEIKGVPVRACSLTDIRVTWQLQCLNQSQLLHWVSQPFIGRADLSTIPKIRYMIKQAPKDTNEAAQQNTRPIPPDTSSVYFTLYFDRHLAIEVEQTEDPYEGEEGVIRTYQKKRQHALRSETMRAVLHRSSPEPEIVIRLKVSKADARAIYRGIPVHAGLALKLQ